MEVQKHEVKRSQLPIIGGTTPRTFMHRRPLPTLPVILPSFLAPSLPSEHHLLHLTPSNPQRGFPRLQGNLIHPQSQIFSLSADIAPRGPLLQQNMQLMSTDFNMATDFEHLSDWGKDAYMDISGKMINAGIRYEKFENGMLKQGTFLGQWLIKELVRPPSLFSPCAFHGFSHIDS